jgi:hypothetical protein
MQYNIINEAFDDPTDFNACTFLFEIGRCYDEHRRSDELTTRRPEIHFGNLVDKDDRYQGMAQEVRKERWPMALSR